MKKNSFTNGLIISIIVHAFGLFLVSSIYYGQSKYFLTSSVIGSISLAKADFNFLHGKKKGKRKNNNALKIPISKNGIESSSNSKEEVGGNDIPLVKSKEIGLNNIDIKYPERAILLKQEGEVIIRVLLDKNSEKEEIKVYRGSGYSLLDEEAKKAVSILNITNTFNKKIWLEIPIVFKLK